MIIPSSSISHHVLMPVGLDLEIDDMENYQDIRIELNATGHNLVCTVCVSYDDPILYYPIDLLMPLIIVPLSLSYRPLS